LDPEPPLLPIHDLAARHVGLTDAIADSYLEAARVCLDRHHQSPVRFRISGPGMEALVEWDRADARILRAWANEEDTTEFGAYACALAALELSEGLVALRRAETRSGADYYVALPDSLPDDLEDAVRFEVSGVSGGAEAVVAQRLRAKLEQAARGDSNLPAMAGVVGFRAQVVLLANLGGP
jgi:hypothetical protein